MDTLKKLSVVTTGAVFMAASASFVAFPAHAVVLTFDIEGAFDSNPINPAFADYGDNATSPTMGTYSYGTAGGFTPNIVTGYSVNASFWTNDYGDLVNVAYPVADSGIFEVTLTADPGFEVALNSFELAGWPDTDYTINSVQVLAGSVPLFSQSNVLVQGETSPFRTSFTNDVLGSSLAAPSLTIRFDSSNLGEASDNIGIDNVQFSQAAVLPTTPVPPPTSPGPTPIPFDFSPGLGLLMLGAWGAIAVVLQKVLRTRDLVN
jgi:hypothetical protein